MNCKPGDLAVVVRSRAGNEGRVFTCVRLATPTEVERQLMFSSMGEPCWVADVKFNARSARGSLVFPGATNIVPDSCARPIRDPGEDATDETLLWLPVPHKETA